MRAIPHVAIVDAWSAWTRVVSGDAVAIDVREEARTPAALELPWRGVWDEQAHRPVEPLELAYHCARRGIGNTTPCIFIDDGNDWRAALVAFVFHELGHPVVAVLDGGQRAWRRAAAEAAETIVVPPRPRGAYSASVVRGAARREDHVGDDALRLDVIDGPAAASRAGALAWRAVFQEDGRFRDEAALRSLFAAYLGPIHHRALHLRVGDWLGWAAVWLAARLALGANVEVVREP